MGVPYSEACCDEVEIAAKVEWSGILNVPSYITTDWSVDQGDTNIDANNIPLLSYAPNTLAANGTPGLSNFNFNQTRKQKLDTIENAAQVNVQADWDEVVNTSDSYIRGKPTLFSERTLHCAQSQTPILHLSSKHFKLTCLRVRDNEKRPTTHLNFRLKEQFKLKLRY